MPLSGQTELSAAVYVLHRYIGDRPVLDMPYTNAERPDTDFFYLHGYYSLFPEMKRAYEDRRRLERRRTLRVQDWAMRALDAMDNGTVPPPTTRTVLSEVLDAMYAAGRHGLTRPEICQALHRDGGKVSGAMTDLHAARIIFPLDGVSRSLSDVA